MTIDPDASTKMLSFALSSRDEKFAQCVKAGDSVLAAKYATSANIDKPIGGAPPLFHAAANGDDQLAATLLDKGASVKTKSAQGWTLAYTAAAAGHPQMAKNFAGMGGGTSSDIAAGTSRYRADLAARQQQTRQGIAAAGALLGLMFAAESSPSAGSGGMSVEERNRAMISENNLARASGNPLPHPGAPTN